VLEGACHAKTTLVLPFVATRDRGTEGTVRGMALTTVLAAPQPTRLCATTRKKYRAPLVNLATVWLVVVGNATFVHGPAELLAR
jgi:hypothetical protein